MIVKPSREYEHSRIEMKYERHNWGKVWQEGLALKKV